MPDRERPPLETDGPEPGSLPLEGELAAYHAAGWRLDEAFWPHLNEQPKYVFISPEGSVFNAHALIHGCMYECDEVTEFSSDVLQAEQWIAGRLLVLQTAYKKKYGDFYEIQRVPAEEYDKWRVFPAR